MAVENKAKEDRYSINKKFLSDFHNNVLSKGKEGKEGKETVTMKITSVGIAKDKHYLLPRFDPETGKEIKNNDDLIKKYMSYIESGKIKSYSSAKEAEADRAIMYPKIIGKKNGN
jgi:hypothetical protein